MMRMSLIWTKWDFFKECMHQVCNAVLISCLWNMSCPDILHTRVSSHRAITIKFNNH